MNTSIILPRPMVNALLHEAQLAGEKPALGIITKKQQAIEQHYPIADNSDDTKLEQTLSKIKHHQETIFAIYRSHDSATHQALSAKLTNANIMQLVISQDIKGVLQLLADQQEIELTIRRSDSAEEAAVTVLS